MIDIKKFILLLFKVHCVVSTLVNFHVFPVINKYSISGRIRPFKKNRIAGHMSKLKVCTVQQQVTGVESGINR